jgi:hypothetical protein
MWQIAPSARLPRRRSPPPPDSAHFVDYLDRFRSADFAANARVFGGQDVAPTQPEAQLERKQWQRGRKALPVLPAGA